MTIKKVLLVTAEPSNFVPVELQKEAEKLGLKAEILDISKTVLCEELEGDSPENFKLKSAVYSVDVEKGTLTEVKVDTETAVIPRLNEYNMLVKIGILKRLEKQGAKLLNSPESMELCNDKLMTQIVLNSAGIKSPYSVMIQGLDEIETVVAKLEEEKKIKYPFVIKTLRGTHGIGVMKVDSRSSLVSVCQLLAKEGLDFMLQEFCKHERSARIIMIGTEMLAANLRGQPKEKDEFRTNSHLGSETEIYKPSDDELNVARQIVELFGCNFCAIDYLITEDKKIIVLEVNGSPGLEAIQKNWPDKNLPKTVIEYIMGTESAEVPPEDVEDQVKDEAPPQVPAPTQDTIGETEIVAINRITSDVEARIDTGAKFCSLHVDHVEMLENTVRFTRGDVTYQVPVFKTVKIRNAMTVNGEAPRRPVVRLDLVMRNTRLNQIEFTLNDRSNMKYEVLIGRNALQALGLPVIVHTDDDKVQHDAPESDVEEYEEEE
jgi:ribosomal protein S6--L-glutamate ligase